MNKLAFSIGDTFLGNTNMLNKGVDGNPLGAVSGLVTLFLNIAFVLAGIILLFFFILGGIGLIGSAGQSDPQKAETAKKTITSAVIGFIVVFVSYWIVKLIGQFLGIEGII